MTQFKLALELFDTGTLDFGMKSWQRTYSQMCG